MWVLLAPPTSSGCLLSCIRSARASFAQYAAAASFASDALRPPWEEVTQRRLLTNKIIVACGRAGPDHYQQVSASMGVNRSIYPPIDVVLRVQWMTCFGFFSSSASVDTVKNDVWFPGQFFLPRVRNVPPCPFRYSSSASTPRVTCGMCFLNNAARMR